MKTKYENGDEVEMVIKTQKESQTGLFSNERLLMIKAGIVSYFSSIPKKFTGSARAIEMSGQVPKFTIAANQISKIQLKGNQLSILVLKSKLISRDQFGQMIKGTKNIPQIQGNIKGSGGGYEQWIFKSQDQESLIQFYHLINLFRTNNPNFQPHLAQMIQGFQNKKNPRKKTMDPSSMIQMPKSIQLPYRHSEIPQSKNLEFLFEKQKVTPSPSSFSQEDALRQNVTEIEMKENSIEQIKVEQDEKSFEDQRLNLVKDKINLNNHPRLSIIQQKPGQDKISEMSKAPTFYQPTIQIIKTFEESIPQISSNQIQEQEVKNQQRIQQIKEQIKQSLAVQEKQQVEQQKAYRQKQILKTERKQTYQFLNHSNSHLQSLVQFQVKKERKYKVNQLIKSACLLHKNDHKIMAQSLGIQAQQLIQFLKINHQDQQETWESIQNQLLKIVSDQKAKSNQTNIFNLQTQIIQNYHTLTDCYKDNDLKSYQLLYGEIQIENYQQENQNQNMIMQWLQLEVSIQLSKNFSTQIFNKFEHKISLRKIVYDQKQIIDASGNWIVNKGGHLQQFLAYLCLQNILKKLKQKQKGKFEFVCEEQFYLKYKQYEGLIKPLKFNKSSYPLKSIKALQFLSKSKGIKFFELCFPQFSINVQILKNQAVYKFNLERISNSFEVSAIKNQLKKISFSIETELQQYQNTNQFKETQKRCLSKLFEMQTQNKKINENILKEIISQSDSNIEIGIIFKFLGARLNKNNQISFQNSILRLGSRQFGLQFSLIQKTRKKGDLQLSHILSKKLMSKLQFYKLVTPSSHFVAVYLQLIDMMILQKGELHKAVPALLRISNFLNQFEIQNYPVYLALMKTYIKLHQIQSFIKTLQNCRLFLSKLLKENAFMFEFQLFRIVLALNTFQNPQKGLKIAQILINKTKNCQNLPQELKQKYISKLIWDKSNIYLTTLEYYQAFSTIYFHLQQLQKKQSFLQSYWIQGVLYLAKSWLQMQQINIMNAANLQKKMQRALSLCLSRQLFDIAFLLKDYGEKIVIKCKQYSLPRFLQNQPSFEQTKIWFNNIREQMLELIIDVE